jgi:hypothetical protein
MNWFILEWNGLDNDIDLYEFESAKEDIAEVWEEASEDLHDFSAILVMDSQRLSNLFRAVSDFTKTIKGGEQKNG